MRDYSSIFQPIFSGVFPFSPVCTPFYAYRYIERIPYRLDTLPYTLEDYDDFTSTFRFLAPLEYSLCESFSNVLKSRVRRYRSFCTSHFDESGHAIFVTLTLSDDYINLPHSTLFTYASRFLKLFGSYALNDDYGKKDNRYHFHALCFTDYINPLLWKYGNCDVKRVYSFTRKLLSYSSKLVNHAFKDYRSRVVYSR